MIYPFVKKHLPTLRRAMCMGVITALSLTALTGCFGLDKADPSNASTDPVAPSGLLDESTSPSSETTVPATSEETTEPATDPANSRLAKVVEEAITHISPSESGRQVTILEVGEEVTVKQVKTLFAVDWVEVERNGQNAGWVVASALDLSNLPSDMVSENTTPAATGETPATKPADSNTGTTTTTGSKKAVVTASELNIRSKAGTDGERLGQYAYGDRITILETSGGWGRTDKGWISLDYVYQDGANGSNPCKGLVTGTTLNIRSGPGTNYDRAGSLNQGDRVQVLERIKIGNTTWGCTKDGWISMDYVYVDGTTGEGSGTGTVTGDQLNIRSGPGTNFDSVGTLNSGATIKIYAQFTFGDMTWGCTDKGWVSMKYVEMN